MNCENTYVISLDALDLNLIPTWTKCKPDKEILPLWTKSNLDMRNNDIYEFRIDSTENENHVDGDSLLNISYTTCHICNIDVPTPFLNQHFDSAKHKINLKITNTALDRIRNSININISQVNNSSSLHFCPVCVTVVEKEEKNIHERSILHRHSVIIEKVLSEFYSLYANENVDINTNETDNIRPETKDTELKESAVRKIDFVKVAQNDSQSLLHNNALKENNKQKLTKHQKISKKREENETVFELFANFDDFVTNATLCDSEKFLKNIDKTEVKLEKNNNSIVYIEPIKRNQSSEGLSRYDVTDFGTNTHFCESVPIVKTQKKISKTEKLSKNNNYLKESLELVNKTQSEWSFNSPYETDMVRDINFYESVPIEKNQQKNKKKSKNKGNLEPMNQTQWSGATTSKKVEKIRTNNNNDLKQNTEQVKQVSPYYHHLEHTHCYVLCKVCKKEIDWNIDGHTTELSHEINYEKFLDENRLYKRSSETIECMICNVYFRCDEEILHCHTIKHISNCERKKRYT